MRLDVPVGGEHDVQRGDDRAGHEGGELPPLPSGLPELGVVVAGLDQVLGADLADPAVHHEDLAVVPQVRPSPAALERLDRQHRMPGEAGFVESAQHLLVPRNPTAAEVVEQHTDGDAAGHRLPARLEERLGHVVPGHDVELHVDVPLGGLDLPGHRRDRLRVVGGELELVAPSAWLGAEPPVERNRRLEPAGYVGRHRGCRDVGHPRGHQLVDPLLHPPAATVDVRAADEQKRQDADERYEEHGQQPGGRRRRTTVLREQAEGCDLDAEVHESHGQGDEQGQVGEHRGRLERHGGSHGDHDRSGSAVCRQCLASAGDPHHPLRTMPSAPCGTTLDGSGTTA